MLLIWGHEKAPNVRKALWGAAELGVAFRLERAGGNHGGLDAAEYRARNPNGRIPTIDDDGYVLWESHAILRYLARREGSSLYPTEPRAAGIVDQWLDRQGTHQGQAVRDLVRLTLGAGAPAAAEALERSRVAAEALFAILEARLQVSRFIAGKSFTIADIPAAVGYERWSTLPIALPRLRATEAWFACLKARPAYPG